MAVKRKDVPWYAKVLAGITIAYALSPIDLIPDFIPVLGQLDDIIILPMLITATAKLIPKDILDDCRTRSAEMWNDGKPKKWTYALPVIIFWMLIVFIIIKDVWL